MRHLSHSAWLCFLVLCLAPQCGLAGESIRDISAREVFTLLPDTIFENTVEGLGEREKQRLLADGQAKFWQLAEETKDFLLFSALPFHDSAVALRLFCDADGEFCLAATGTIGGSLCTLELWRMDNAGRIVPVDGPPEPDIRDFLRPGQVLPGGIQPSTVVCLDFDGLKAQPLFWSSAGLVHLPVAREVRYQWNGKAFEKRISVRAAP
ncbi:MAG: hypothetical protein LBN96_09195 [Desulfovibrio sp.]|jgi:hypothetical protein|nr:hypothetical protein [Desulfovibrio sp.]